MLTDKYGESTGVEMLFFATVIVKINTSRRHQSMLNLGGNIDEKQYICMILKVDISTSICDILGRAQHQSYSIQAGNI